MLVSAYSRYSSFCGAKGLELCEPMSFKGRQGSGLSPERRIYADPSLVPLGGDWKKYLYGYRLWGRHLYNPDLAPEQYRRYLRHEFGAAAENVEVALGNASRVIPLITSAHMPSASAMTYWPEMYTNMPIADPAISHPYSDTPSPKTFTHVSPLDPATFSAIEEFVDEQLSAHPSGRYSPADVARWLDQFAATAEQQIKAARSKVRDPKDSGFRRMEIDTRLQAGLGRFFAAKLRAGIAYSVYEKRKDASSLQAAVTHYRAARDAWAGVARLTDGVYVRDLTFGYPPHRRGHWSDRLPAIDRDLTAMRKMLSSTPPESSAGVVTELLEPRSPMPACRHRPPGAFTAGQPLDIEITSRPGAISRVRIHYRHVDQAEEYRTADMTAAGDTWRFRIPETYTDSVYSLLYFFELHAERGTAWLYPGLNAEVSNLPYFVVRRRMPRSDA